MRAIPKAAIDFVAEHEGWRDTAYQDSVGVWTIGWGHTGPEVRAGLKINRAQGRVLLGQDLRVAAARLENKIGAGVVADLTANQYAALLSFVFNLGTPGTTIWKRLRARQFDQVPVEMMRFVYAGGKKLRGLVARRAEEVKLWSADEPGSADEAPPSSVTRAIATPPVSSDPAPASKSGGVLTLVGGAVAAVPVAVTQVTQAISPYAAQSELVQRVVAGLAVVAAVAVVAGLAIAWLKKREARS